ncbi:hypothetical protein D5I55_00005, partial [Chakrabartia godavariana]
PNPIVDASSNTQLFGSDTLSGGSYAFTDSHAGNGNRTVTVGNVTVNDGFAGGNYAVSYVANTTSTINPAALTVTALAQTKVYDGTTSVTSSALGTGYSVSGLIGSESLSGVTLAYANQNVSRVNGVVQSDKVITIGSAVAGSGTQLTDYAVSYVNNSTSTITPAPLRVTTLDVSKIYDGTTSAAGTAVVVQDGVTQLIAGATLSGGSFAYANADAGLNKTVTVSSVSVNDGNSGGNYFITYVPNVTSTIRPRTVSLSATKMFDGTANLDGFVEINTGVAGQKLAYSGALAYASQVEFVGNYIKQIQLLDSSTARAANYQLPVLNAENAPALIAMATPMKVVNPDTYQTMATTTSAPVTTATMTNAVVVDGAGVKVAEPVATPATAPASTAPEAPVSAAPEAPAAAPTVAPSVNMSGPASTTGSTTSVALSADRAFIVPLATTALFNVPANAPVTVTTTLADGSALPAWVRYDAAQGSLVGEAPEGVSSLAVRITAVDENGNSVSTDLVLQFETK